MPQDDCIIDEKINEFIMSIKKYKSVLMATLIINMFVCLFIFMLWYLYSHSLPKLEDKDKLSIILDFFTAIGTVGAVITSLYLANRKPNFNKIMLVESINVMKGYQDAYTLVLVCRNFSGYVYKVNTKTSYIYNDLDMFIYLDQEEITPYSKFEIEIRCSSRIPDSAGYKCTYNSGSEILDQLNKEFDCNNDMRIKIKNNLKDQMIKINRSYFMKELND